MATRGRGIGVRMHAFRALAGRQRATMSLTYRRTGCTFWLLLSGPQTLGSIGPTRTKPKSVGEEVVDPIARALYVRLKHKILT